MSNSKTTVGELASYTTTNKKCIIIGGGTFSHVANHLSLASPAFGTTAKQLYTMCGRSYQRLDVELILTKMADSNSNIVTNQDLSDVVDRLISSNLTKIIFFNAAVCDFTGTIDGKTGKYSQRLQTKDGSTNMQLVPDQMKIVKRIRQHRKDIFVVAFKTTCGASESEQYAQGLKLLKGASVNLVLANDTLTKNNIIITPEEGVIKGERDQLLKMLTEMAYQRSHLTFTRSTVTDGRPVPWHDERVYGNLREVVGYLVQQGAYKQFNGATTGHFAAKLDTGHFLTSIRKTNFNDIDKNGMVEVRTDGDDNVIAIGAKPSVGGQSQRIIFDSYPEMDCIAHFHCPLNVDHRDAIDIMSQWQYECGSHQCGQNTKNGLKQFGNLYAVMLDNHGPNIVFSKNTPASEVIDFINNNFDLSKPTNGFKEVYL